MSKSADREYIFLFTDIEGSTKLWEKYPDKMRAALARHDILLREGSEAHGGHIFKTIGDAFCVAFSDPLRAAQSSLEIQEALEREAWEIPGGIKVRMALYGGEAEARDNDYFGMPLNRCARLRDVVHGQQLVVPEVLKEQIAPLLPDVEFVDRGYHRLKDVPEPLHLFQMMRGVMRREFPPLRSLSTHPHNLPAAISSFVGRRAEREWLSNLLARPDVRLITLSGFGGAGKTRLAQEIGRELLERYPQGVWFVDLSPLDRPEQVLPAIIQAIGIKEEATRSPLELLSDYLRDARTLVILDNFEQVEEAADDVAALLRHCHSLQILVTSRILLNLSMEFVYEMPPLSSEECRELFGERARQAQPTFVETSENHPLLEGLCQLFEGMPLVVELAAAQMRTLPLETIYTALSERIEALSTKMRDLPPRHRSLRGAIDWSYDLLSQEEKQLFRQLSVFLGGFTTEAARAVCKNTDPAAAFTSDLQELRENSLIRQTDTPERFALLESLRQYGADRLAEASEEAQTRQRHRDWFLFLAEQAQLHYGAPEQAEWLVKLEADHANLNTAIDWSASQKEEVQIGLRLSGALGYYWEVRGYFREGREHLMQLLSLSVQTKTKERTQALNTAGHLAWYQGDFITAERLQQECRELCHALGDQAGTAGALVCLGDIAYARGDFEAARALQMEALEIRRQLQDQSGIITSLTNLGNIAFNQQNYAEAQPYYEECFVEAQALGDQRRIASALANLGTIAFMQERYEEAREYDRQSLHLSRLLGEKQVIGQVSLNLAGVVVRLQDYEQAGKLFSESLCLLHEVGDMRTLAFALEGMANLALHRERFSEAVRLYASAETLRQEIGSPLPPATKESVETDMHTLQERLGEMAFQENYLKGQKQGLEATLEEALNK